MKIIGTFYTHWLTTTSIYQAIKRIGCNGGGSTGQVFKVNFGHPPSVPNQGWRRPILRQITKMSKDEVDTISHHSKTHVSGRFRQRLCTSDHGPIGAIEAE
jgi:hypothetical protein